VVPGGIRGLAVHETARIMALGKGGDILVSGTTRELSAGPGFTFLDHGVHHLKGIPAARQIFLLAAADNGGDADAVRALDPARETRRRGGDQPVPATTGFQQEGEPGEP